ncbi:hypothetical protein [Streptomyces shenzhenensis]|uniref:hypothetical protein n=1 Tax=Streptomyces shenzhenensis TaxID=943815 RepID=UPI001F45F05B|nr:hypothetical protein [Streptomyces shenzhenensis]
MRWETRWQTGEGLLGLDDPAEWDAAFERGEDHLGTAVIGLALNCPLEAASPRIVRAIKLPDQGERGYACTAAGTAARLNGRLTPELFAALRVEGPVGTAKDAIGDTLTFVPFRDLPPWFKWRWVYVTVRGTLEHWWLWCTDAVENGRRVLRGRRLR